MWVSPRISGVEQLEASKTQMHHWDVFYNNWTDMLH